MAMLNSYTTGWNFDSNQQIVVKTYFDKKKNLHSVENQSMITSNSKLTKSMEYHIGWPCFFVFFLTIWGTKLEEQSWLLKLLTKLLNHIKNSLEAPVDKRYKQYNGWGCVYRGFWLSNLMSKFKVHCIKICTPIPAQNFTK